MPNITELIDSMDSLLASLQERGGEPKYWIIRHEDWMAVREQFKLDVLPDPSAVGANTYRGVPVHFRDLKDREVVAIVHGDREHVETSERLD